MPITIHSGLGKTATTTLQEVVFPETQNHKYLGKTHRLMKYDRHTIEKIDHSDIDIYLNSSDDDQILSVYFQLCHLLIHEISIGKNLCKKASVIRRNIESTQTKIMQRNLHQLNYLVSHEKLSHLHAHACPDGKHKGEYAIIYRDELFGIFGEMSYINTTRKFEDYLVSMYFQMMIVRLNIGKKSISPTSYFRLQKNIHDLNRGLSIFEAYKRWSTRNLFVNSFKMKPTNVTVLSLESMRSRPITDVLESTTTIRFPSKNRKQIDLNFSCSSQKITSQDPIKKKIINLISRANNLDPDSVIFAMRTWVSKTYGDLEKE